MEDKNVGIIDVMFAEEEEEEEEDEKAVVDDSVLEDKVSDDNIDDVGCCDDTIDVVNERKGVDDSKGGGALEVTTMFVEVVD